MESETQWRHFIEGGNHEILIQCDHKNLEYCQTLTVLSGRQARSAEMLSLYNFVIEHLAGKRHPPDGPSRQPDHQIGYERPMARFLATLAATTINQPYGDLLLDIETPQKYDLLATKIKPTLVNVPNKNKS